MLNGGKTRQISQLSTSGTRYIHTHMHTHAYIYADSSRTVFTHTYIHTYIHTSTHPHIHTHIHTYIHTGSPIASATSPRTHIHTYMHAYIHTCIQVRLLLVPLLQELTGGDAALRQRVDDVIKQAAVLKGVCVCKYVCMYACIYVGGRCSTTTC